MNTNSGVQGGSAYGTGADPTLNAPGGLGGDVPVTGEHHAHHGHHHGHHGHHAGAGVTGGNTTVDTPHEKTTDKIAKMVPGTEANKEHKANQQAGDVGYGATGAGTGASYGSTTGTGTDYESTRAGTGAGYGTTGATGTGGSYGTDSGLVDSNVGGTGAGYGTTSTGTGTTSTGTGVGGTTTSHTGHHHSSGTGAASATGGNTTIGTDHPSTKDKIMAVLPGTEQHKEKKALKETGQL